MIYTKFIAANIYKRMNGAKKIIQTMPQKPVKNTDKCCLRYAPELEPVLSPIPLTIRLGTSKEHKNHKYAYGIKSFIDSPWTSAQNVFKKNAATENIMECSSAGIISAQKIKMAHINPNAPLNKNFSHIADEFLKDIDTSDYNIRGFVLGSLDYDMASKELFNKFCNLLKALRIPFSSLKTGDKTKFNGNLTPLERYFGINTLGQNISYNSKNKELLINNRIIDKSINSGETNAEKLLKMSFDETNLLKNDKVLFSKNDIKNVKPKGRLFAEEEKVLREKAKSAINDIEIKEIYYDAIGETLPQELQECKEYAQKYLCV